MSLPGQLIRFGCVGGAAAATHLGVVAALVPAGLPPLVANALAFAVAFQVSYYGHRGWTFRSPGGRGEYFRLLLVSLVSFALNEALYAAMLRFAPLDYRLSLALVLAAVAVFTFAGSRLWVFAARATEPS